MTKSTMDPADEVARLLALLIRLQVKSQSQAIVELDHVGFGAKRIAEFLGTTPNTVSVALQKKRARKSAPGAANDE
jgi:predicted transcriptional regulator